MTCVPLQIQEQLRDSGYRNQFQFREGAMLCLNSGQRYRPEQLRVHATFRFEEDSDPGEGALLWVLKAHDGTGGVFEDAYGLYGDPEAAEFISRIPDRRRRCDLMQQVPAAKTIRIYCDHGEITLPRAA